MLKIRKAQMEVLSQISLRNFENQMVQHLNEFFPDACRQMGDDEISSFVKYGIGKAKKYSVTSKKDVCRYLNLMMILGVRFDEDEALPWAGEILNSSSLSSGETKMMYLNQTATQYLEEQENRDNKKQETVEQHWWFN